MFGLSASGLTPKGVEVLEATRAINLRRIARSPSHIARETTEALRSRLGLPSIREYLCATWTPFRDDRSGLTLVLPREDFFAHTAVC